MNRPEIIDGYASIFGEPDLSGDVVRGGAFAASLAAKTSVPMLLQHKNGAIAGRWVAIRETGRGLYVRGLVESDGAKRLLDRGLDGLSIGFRPKLWRPRAQGRDLIAVDLVEISLVSAPMQPLARLTRLLSQRHAA
ncbi:MAG: HK97 family phage prohead protease [Pseudomonadota bacterium]